MSRRWLARFVETGGVAYLVHLLMQWPTDFARSDARRRRCLALMLRLINICVLDKPQPITVRDRENNNNADNDEDDDDAEQSQDEDPIDSRDFLGSARLLQRSQLTLSMKELKTDIGK